MLFKNLIYIFLWLVLILFLPGLLCFSAESQQKIKDFYLSNFKENGTRDWEVKGKEAVIYDSYVDINEMKANCFLEGDTVVITSDQARLNKKNMDVYLKDNVHIENQEGIELFSDSLDWQREKNHIKTDDWVKASKDTLQITGEGLSADTQLKKADFKKDVEVTFSDPETKDVTTAICSGPLEIEYAKGKAVFNKDVVVTHAQGKLFSDKATLFFDAKEKRIIKIISEGNVKIERENNITFAERAIYFAQEQKLILEGTPRLIYYTKEGNEL
jgi:LPS export ABC transporter protein LptC